MQQFASNLDASAEPDVEEATLLQAIIEVSQEGQGLVKGFWMVGQGEHYFVYPKSMPRPLVHAFMQS